MAEAAVDLAAETGGSGTSALQHGFTMSCCPPPALELPGNKQGGTHNRSMPPRQQKRPAQFDPAVGPGGARAWSETATGQRPAPKQQPNPKKQKQHPNPSKKPSAAEAVAHASKSGVGRVFVLTSRWAYAQQGGECDFQVSDSELKVLGCYSEWDDLAARVRREIKKDATELFPVLQDLADDDRGWDYDDDDSGFVKKMNRTLLDEGPLGRHPLGYFVHGREVVRDGLDKGFKLAWIEVNGTRGEYTFLLEAHDQRVQ